jgi:hypothetical protein
MNKVFIFVLMSAVLVYGCTSDKKKEHSAAFSSDENETEVVCDDEERKQDDDVLSSEIDLSEMSDEGTQMVTSMDKLNKDMNKINSPEKLLENREEYEQRLAETYDAISKAPTSEEKSKLKSRLNEIQHNYNSKKRSYLMPANGIVQNINKLTKRLEACQSKQDFMNILDPRISYFKNLPKLYTLVEEDNRRQEVRELAEQLNVLFQKKKAQFGVVDY